MFWWRRIGDVYCRTTRAPRRPDWHGGEGPGRKARRLSRLVRRGPGREAPARPRTPGRAADGATGRDERDHRLRVSALAHRTRALDGRARRAAPAAPGPPRLCARGG